MVVAAVVVVVVVVLYVYQKKKVIDERKFTFGRFTNDLMVSLNNHVFPCMWLCMSVCNVYVCYRGPV